MRDLLRGTKEKRGVPNTKSVDKKTLDGFYDNSIVKKLKNHSFVYRSVKSINIGKDKR